ncbi:MAG: class I SAM-dependent methyltransferase [Myxococcales bacterium]|nr:MAG: class I SAM-dependent methyltransferase [Myxococcales bacterium]
MLLNKAEKLLMNNPLRAAVQRYYEARRLRDMGGVMNAGHALEIGCGRGVGAEIILELFGADRVDAFDLDEDMVRRAEARLERFGDRVRLWTGDATAIQAEDETYDAVFDFGIIHHIPDWRSALREVYRVLKPGGRFYADEMFERFLSHPVARALLNHPREDRFDHARFAKALEDSGLHVEASYDEGHFGFFVAMKTPDGVRRPAE